MRHQIKYFCSLLISLLLWSCAATPPTADKTVKTEYPLTKNIAYSLSSTLQLHVPAGWFTSEDNECNCIDIWLIRDDFSATINLMTLETDTIQDETPKDEIARLLTVSKEKRSAKLSDRFIQIKEDEFFVISERQYAAYEFQGDEGLPVRVVVFRYKDKYFEMSAMPASEVGGRPVNPTELFEVQKAVLSSIR